MSLWRLRSWSEIMEFQLGIPCGDVRGRRVCRNSGRRLSAIEYCTRSTTPPVLQEYSPVLTSTSGGSARNPCNGDSGDGHVCGSGSGLSATRKALLGLTLGLTLSVVSKGTISAQGLARRFERDLTLTVAAGRTTTAQDSSRAPEDSSCESVPCCTRVVCTRSARARGEPKPERSNCQGNLAK